MCKPERLNPYMVITTRLVRTCSEDHLYTYTKTMYILILTLTTECLTHTGIGRNPLSRLSMMFLKSFHQKLSKCQILSYTLEVSEVLQSP